jgi:hypothetical protein
VQTIADIASSSLNSKLVALRERSKTRNTSVLIESTSGLKAPLFKTPFGAQTRAASNPLARCAVFAPVKQRMLYDRYITVGHFNGFPIEIKGEQLNQDDHDTLLQLIKMAEGVEYGVDFSVSVNSMLNGLNRATWQAQRRQLFEQVDRLVSTTLRITASNGMRYIGHIIDDASTPEDQEVLPYSRRNLTYRLNPKFAFLYQNNQYTLVDFEKRLALKGRGSELAKWLHLWIDSHAKQYSHKVETIREKCGSQVKELRNFRLKLKQALGLLQEVGLISDWAIDDADLVHVTRNAARSQIKHLKKNKKMLSK